MYEFNVPLPNRFFTERVEILEFIHNELLTQKQRGSTASIALYGLGGRLHKNEFDIILWADDQEALIAGYVEVSEHFPCVEKGVR